MIARLSLTLLACFALLAGCRPRDDYIYTVSAPPASYTLGAGDQIRVIVFDQDQVTGLYFVDASGKISVPLVGNVRAAHRTTQQVERAIAARLRAQDIIKEPRVSAEVVLYRPYFILGEVSAPGKYQFNAGLTVEKAVATAGGYTIYADKYRIRITRQEGGELVTIPALPFDVVRPGDSVFIEGRWF